MLVTGSSYGGYLRLMSLEKWPDLSAGGMAVVAIADWTFMSQDAAQDRCQHRRPKTFAFEVGRQEVHRVQVAVEGSFVDA